ncbi:hypothetical protein [Chitinophaga sp. Cy-1792]|uniref:hypothetical protein n=1 Tax=Chitinophaga sp. Cy-1792 TaxID=2608339 RepID=UPI00141D7C4D|nr:hypothetical protein [Chitinophaga sp. Cy-1792]NIG53372.1 hypothetical protein [Chitinophaga sp. Cy-1792]
MWTYKKTYAIGGLENVGFAENTDNLIVLSGQGKGIFNCISAEKTDRINDDWWEEFDESTGTVHGFGILEGSLIQTGGLYGDHSLPHVTADGWQLITRENEPDDPPFEHYRVTKIFLVSPDGKEIFFITKDGPCELMAYGFSPTGNSLIVALSCDLVIWSRDGGIL